MVTAGFLAGAFAANGWAQDQRCTLVTVYQGFLYHSDGSVAPFDTLCFPTTCDGVCAVNPWLCGPCAYADSSGWYEYQLETIALRSGDVAGGLGGTIAIAGRSRCRVPACNFLGYWDGADFPCPPPYVIIDTITASHTVDEGTLPILPPPNQVFAPDHYSGSGEYIFYWAAVTAASGYNLQIDTATNGGFDHPLWKDTLVPSHAVVISNVPQSFRWRVRANNGCSTSAWTTHQVFSSVSESRDGEGSSTHGLTQNYPNPFNTATVIRFDLETVTDWSLTVFNILGQTVRRFSGEQSSGSQEVEWHGDDGIGNAMPSGIYFYRVETSRWMDSRKMILLR